MQITSNNGFPPPVEGGNLDITSQLLAQRMRHAHILQQRAFGFWWYRIVFIVLTVLLAGVSGFFLNGYPFFLIPFAVIFVLPIVFWLGKNPEFAFLIAAIVTTAIAPKIATIKSLDIFPSLPVLILIFCVLGVQVAFHVRRAVFPSFWVLWPSIGLLIMAFVSDIMVQLTWTRGVPHKINGNPIIYIEILGVGAFFLPLIVFFVTTTIVARKETLIRTVLNAFLIISFFISFAVLYDFKRIGGDIYAFRFSEPHIFWMSLRAIAQILALACMIAYARFLYADPIRVRLHKWYVFPLTFLLPILGPFVFAHWRNKHGYRDIVFTTAWSRIVYLLLTVLFLACIIITLQNSWWIEVAVGAIVMTIVYSRRFLTTLVVVMLPLVPVFYEVVKKVQSVKTDDYTRIWIWQDALRVWSKQRILGVGPGNFWAYDQVFTNLPRGLRNFNSTGLGVAHNGYLQILGELGPMGEFFWLSFIVVVIVMAARLFRRSKMKEVKGAGAFLDFIGLPFFANPEKRDDRVLALICLGLIAGSAAADTFAGGFFIPPRQVGILAELSQVITSWLVWGFVMYKDQIWRMTQRGADLNKDERL